MTKVIGVTGMMGSGKTTLINRLKETDTSNSFQYLNVDNFRRSIKELEALKPFIYKDFKKMVQYKKVLYKKIIEHLKDIDKTIVVEWALIVEDDITNLFDFLVIVDCEQEEILRRLTKGDLTQEEITNRLKSQMTTKEKIIKLKDKDYIIINKNYDIKKLIELMKG